jgi:hypothetical protein
MRYKRKDWKRGDWGYLADFEAGTWCGIVGGVLHEPHDFTSKKTTLLIINILFTAEYMLL